MESKKTNDYRTIILKALEDSPLGLTIKDLSIKTGYHRNTISKYVNVLEAEGCIRKKKVSAAKLYFNTKRTHIPIPLISSFFQSLFSVLKDRFPNIEEDFIEMGKKIQDEFEFPIGQVFLRRFNKLNVIDDIQEKLKFFPVMYNSFDFLQDEIDISVIELRANKMIYRLKNSDFLEYPGKKIYFYYLVCGIAERIYEVYLQCDIKCNIEKIHISKNKEESYIDIVLNVE